jgi:alpha,alpha-trehalase
MNRRDVLKTAGAATALAATSFSPGAVGASGTPASAPTATPPDKQQWETLDAEIRKWWDADTSHALEKQVHADSKGSLLFLPFPFLGPNGPGRVFETMYGWDTDFINQALIAHDRPERVRDHIRNYLFMVDRFGYMPNTNVIEASTRSQTPLIADSLWRYYTKTQDLDLLYEAYPRLKRNYRDYWTAAHHQTPIGLATNRDLGDRHLPPEYAAEAETGLDWTPIFGGDVRRCVPLITNCALVRYTDLLARIAKQVGRVDEARQFTRETETRAALIRKYCWSESAGLFLEYDYAAGKQLPYLSACAYWTLWAGVATRAQARRLVENLPKLEQPHGLATTDKAYALPPEAKAQEPACFVSPEGRFDMKDNGDTLGGHEKMQWMYPAGWAPLQLIAIEGLDRYGYTQEAKRLATAFLTTLIEQYRKTGQLWEKYNMVDGSVVLPNARCGNIHMHGWTAAAAALLGRYVFEKRSLAIV